MKSKFRIRRWRARIQRHIRARGAASAQEALRNLLDTQEEKDGWLLEDREAIQSFLP